MAKIRACFRTIFHIFRQICNSCALGTKAISSYWCSFDLIPSRKCSLDSPLNCLPAKGPVQPPPTTQKQKHVFSPDKGRKTVSGRFCGKMCRKYVSVPKTKTLPGKNRKQNAGVEGKVFTVSNVAGWILSVFYTVLDDFSMASASF